MEFPQPFQDYLGFPSENILLKNHVVHSGVMVFFLEQPNISALESQFPIKFRGFAQDYRMNLSKII